MLLLLYANLDPRATFFIISPATVLTPLSCPRVDRRLAGMRPGVLQHSHTHVISSPLLPQNPTLTQLYDFPPLRDP